MSGSAATTENCCVCLTDTPTLTKLNEIETAVFRSLSFCVPEVLFEEWYNICSQCLDEVQTIHEFREKCIRADATRKQKLALLSVVKDERTGLNVEIKEEVTCCDVEDGDEGEVEGEEIEEDGEREIQDGGQEIEDGGQETEDGEQETEDGEQETEEVISVSDQKFSDSERKYACNVCGKAFYEERCLKGHYLVHSNEKAFKCDLCPNSYKRPYALKVHQKKKHNVGTINVAPRVKKFTCHQCGAKFYANTLLQAHVRKHTGEKPHECTICGKGFIYINYLKKHMLCHGEKRFKCETCGMGFTRNRYLVKHMERDH